MSRLRTFVIGRRQGRDHLLFKQRCQRGARAFRRFQQLRHHLVGLIVIIGQDIAIVDGTNIVRGDDGQCALDACMQRSSELLTHLTAQRNQTAPKGAA